MAWCERRPCGLGAVIKDVEGGELVKDGVSPGVGWLVYEPVRVESIEVSTDQGVVLTGEC